MSSRRNNRNRPKGKAASGQALSYATNTRTTRPNWTSYPDGRTRVKHRELITTVNSGAVADEMSCLAYSLNPGIADTFPWLSQMATLYEKYKFHKLSFHFVTRASTTDRGNVLMATDYDAADGPPQSEVVASSYEGTIEGPVWRDLTHNCNRAAAQGMLYVRDAAVVGTDIKTYDVGNFFLCTLPDASSVNLALGKLWVEYEVEFKIPQLKPEAGPAPPEETGVQYNYTDIGDGDARPVVYRIVPQDIDASETHLVPFRNTDAEGANLVPYAAGVFGPFPDGKYRLTASFDMTSCLTPIASMKNVVTAPNTQFASYAAVYTGQNAAQVNALTYPAPVVSRSYHNDATNSLHSFSCTLQYLFSTEEVRHQYIGIGGGVSTQAITPGEFYLGGGAQITIEKIG